MKRKLVSAFAIIFAIASIPAVSALSVQVSNGSSVDVGENELLTDFGMVTGQITFKLGNLSWIPTEIWLIPNQIEPNIFSKGLTQQTTIEIPENVTSSTCRTAVYYNQTSGHGFKIYNTGTTTQIFANGTFCGLAYNGTYFVFARY